MYWCQVKKNYLAAGTSFMIWANVVLLCILQIGVQSQRLSDPCVCMSRSAYIFQMPIAEGLLAYVSSLLDTVLCHGLTEIFFGHISQVIGWWKNLENLVYIFPSYLMIDLESIRKTWWESKTQKNCCGMFTLLLPILFMYTLGQMILVLIQGHLGWLFY